MWLHFLFPRSCQYNRSPLNVVHAGLDLLRSELSICPVMAPAITDLMELVEDMFSASESAINILNDLLNYENLDAGSTPIALQFILIRVFFIYNIICLNSSKSIEPFLLISDALNFFSRE